MGASWEQSTYPLINLVCILDNAVTAVFSKVEHTKLPWVDAIWHYECCVHFAQPELTRWESWSIANPVNIGSSRLTRVL